MQLKCKLIINDFFCISISSLAKTPKYMGNVLIRSFVYKHFVGKMKKKKIETKTEWIIQTKIGTVANLRVPFPAALTLDAPSHAEAIPFPRQATDRMKAVNNSNRQSPEKINTNK